MSEAPPPGRVGLLPFGALSAAFFMHLGGREGGRVRFLGRRDSASTDAILSHGSLSITTGGETRTLPAGEICHRDLLSAYEAGFLPEVVVVSANSDQLLDVLREAVGLLERLCADAGLDAAADRWPRLVLSSNGIYHERVRRFLVELLEESMLFGRLPDLWDGAMGRLVGKLLRGVTFQTGLREGSGVDAVYRPGPPRKTTVAGGSAADRSRAVEVLAGLGGWFVETDAKPVRTEFDKALVNLWANLLGQLRGVDADGRFTPLRVGEILTDVDDAELRDLSGHLFAVGRAVRAYAADEDFDALHRDAFAMASAAAAHVPSSVQQVASELAAGRLRAKLTPTEEWLIEPLTRYARTAGLGESVDYFESLRSRVVERLKAAIARRA